MQASWTVRLDSPCFDEPQQQAHAQSCSAIGNHSEPNPSLHQHVLRLQNVTLPTHDNQPRPQMTAKDNPNADAPVEKPTIAKKPYQFLHVGLLREYLALEFAVPTPFEWKQERIYDDFGAVWVHATLSNSVHLL